MCLLRDDDEQFRNNKMQIKTNKLKFFKTETTNTSTQIYLFIFNRPRPDPIRGLDPIQSGASTLDPGDVAVGPEGTPRGRSRSRL